LTLFAGQGRHDRKICDFDRVLANGRHRSARDFDVGHARQHRAACHDMLFEQKERGAALNSRQSALSSPCLAP